MEQNVGTNGVLQAVSDYYMAALDLRGFYAAAFGEKDAERFVAGNIREAEREIRNLHSRLQASLAPAQESAER